jgi:hypothetical protein
MVGPILLGRGIVGAAFYVGRRRSSIARPERMRPPKICTTVSKRTASAGKTRSRERNAELDVQALFIKVGKYRVGRRAHATLVPVPEPCGQRDCRARTCSVRSRQPLAEHTARPRRRLVLIRFPIYLVDVLGQAVDAAWHELQSAVLPVDAALAREELAARILFAADQGERDPERLKTSRACGLSNALNLMQRAAERCFGYRGIWPTTCW